MIRTTRYCVACQSMPSLMDSYFLAILLSVLVFCFIWQVRPTCRACQTPCHLWDFRAVGAEAMPLALTGIVQIGRDEGAGAQSPPFEPFRACLGSFSV